MPNHLPEHVSFASDRQKSSFQQVVQIKQQKTSFVIRRLIKHFLIRLPPISVIASFVSALQRRYKSKIVDYTYRIKNDFVRVV